MRTIHYVKAGVLGKTSYFLSVVPQDKNCFVLRERKNQFDEMRSVMK